MPSPLDPAALPVTPERITQLRGFGLSEYAARAYLALLDLGTTEARDVAGLSKVPASKIYHILDHLHEKGLVVLLPEFPRKYAPVPFVDFLRRIHDEHMSAAQRIEDEEDALARTFAVVGQTSAGDRGSVTIVRGRRNVTERALEIIATSAASLVALSTSREGSAGHPWDAALDAARSRGVHVELVPDEVARRASLPSATFMLIADGRRALLGHCVPDDGHPTEGSDTGLDIDQEGLVRLLGALLVGDARPAPGEWPFPASSLIVDRGLRKALSRGS